MCWIFAYNWKENSIPFLIEWLRNLEYRGYDSAWIFWVNIEKKTYLEKAIWKVSVLAGKVEKEIKNKEISYTNGIAHTRWATHGKVTYENTHPHFSKNERFFVVHNWIIENYMTLKEELQKKYINTTWGSKFYSDTDTEIIAKLIEDLFDWDILQTVEKVTKKLIWAYSIAIIDKENPDTLIWAKLWSPMIVWLGKDWVFISSDINALNRVAHEFTTIEDHETVVIKNWKYKIYSLWEEIQKEHEKIDKNFEVANKWKFKTFTEKEIHEIPSVLRNALKWRIDFEKKEIHNETLAKLNSYEIESIEIIASGSSYFAWVVWKNWFETLSSIKTEVRVSSEFLYETFIPNKKTLYIVMSQSGETADVRESVKMINAKWCLTFWIVNVVGSTIARMCSMWLYTHSGIEIWVASTKNIIWQLAVLLTMSLSIWMKKNLQFNEAKDIIEHLEKLDRKLEWLLEQRNAIKSLAKKYAKYSNFFFLWRNLVYGTACECSLKLKELSYIHAEAYSTWELKHWPLALVWPGFPCVVINPKCEIREKTISNIKEIKARNGLILWIITAWDSVKDIYDDIIEIPKTNTILNPFLPLIPLWIFAVEIAKNLNRDIDKPQNLAKSVTVE
jgi:glutamine---fructose-6-phosphate transaminase (isomerizing)